MAVQERLKLHQQGAGGHVLELTGSVAPVPASRQLPRQSPPAPLGGWLPPTGAGSAGPPGLTGVPEWSDSRSRLQDNRPRDRSPVLSGKYFAKSSDPIPPPPRSALHAVQQQGQLLRPQTPALPLPASEAKVPSSKHLGQSIKPEPSQKSIFNRLRHQTTFNIPTRHRSDRVSVASTARTAVAGSPAKGTERDRGH